MEIRIEIDVDCERCGKRAVKKAFSGVQDTIRWLEDSAFQVLLEDRNVLVCRDCWEVYRKTRDAGMERIFEEFFGDVNA